MSIKTVLDVPTNIAQGLAAGIYTRSGGTIRDAQTGNIVALLRDAAPTLDLLQGVTAVTGFLNLGVSVLNLGVSVVGFSAVIDRLGRLEQELQNTKEILLKSNQELSRKIDLSFYANFAAALKLAQSAFTMNDAENRKASAFQAVNRFLETEEIYYGYARGVLDSKARGAEQYLFTLALAYLAEFRCYLELGEIDSAQFRLRESVIIFRSLVETYVSILLTGKPCVYLHSEVQDEISLSRLTKIIQWLKQDKSIDENDVFQRNRQDLFTLHHKFDNWKESLPDAVRAELDFKGYPATFKGLPQLINKMEAMIETFQRLEAYGEEIQVMQQLGLSFQEWLHLSDLVTTSNSSEQKMVCILIPELAAV